MAAKPLTMNPNYLLMVRGTRELHKLLAAGKDDSPEADAIRDATDGPWEALSEVERNRIRKLSEDLYALVEPAPISQPIRPQAQAELNEANEARQNGDWDRALELLRRLAPFLSADVLSFFRGRTWLDAGDAETAVFFLGHACRLQPDNGSYLTTFLYALERVDPHAALARAQGILLAPDKVSPIVVVRAADIVFDARGSLPETEASHQARQLIPVIDRALARAETEGGMDRSHVGIAILLQSRCHELLGNTKAAVDSLGRGLQSDPDNPGFLVMRGTLLYGSSPRAIDDLELAIRNGSTEIWPFYFLARHHLLTGRFEDSRRLCERALAMRGSPAVMSEISEWMAITQAELGFPAEMVRASLENATRFDPSNERATRNLAAFGAANPTITHKTWETRSANVVRMSALAERRYLPAVATAAWSAGIPLIPDMI